jgi:hypothetical protein
LRATGGRRWQRLVSGCRLYRPPDSVFLPPGESGLRNPVTFAPSQQVLLPLAGDLKLDGRM